MCDESIARSWGPVNIRQTLMVSENSQPRRAYRKRRRADREADTRRQITEATVELHGTIGPARTTIKGIAAQAGVQRATVYRHFPDLESLFLACSTHWASLNPPPDPAAWDQIADTDERLRHALTSLRRRPRTRRGCSKRRFAATTRRSTSTPGDR